MNRRHPSAIVNSALSLVRQLSHAAKDVDTKLIIDMQQINKHPVLADQLPLTASLPVFSQQF